MQQKKPRIPAIIQNIGSNYNRARFRRQSDFGGRGFRCRRLRLRQFQCERAALAGLAFDANGTAEGLHEVLYDGQP
jgi:hypothetical protein